MHVRIFYWLAMTLALAVATNATAVKAQDMSTTVPQGAYYAADASQVTMSGDVQNNVVAENKSLTNQNAELSARLAEVEKSLKKMDDKAKEDKKKAEGMMTATPSGRIHLDAADFSQDAVSKQRYNEQNGVEFRTARLAIYGGGFNVIKYQIEYDFASVATTSTLSGNAVTTSTRLRCKDTYFMITDLPLVQNVQIGHFKEPFSLDELTSDNYITFMERNTASLMMAPSRHFGIMGFGNTESQNATYALGAFYEYDDEGNIVQNDNMGGAMTMRGTWLPYYDEATEGRGLIHTGLAYSYRDPYRDQCALKYRPESHLAKENSLTLTDVSERNEVGAELASVWGPLSFQSEYYVNYIDRTQHVDSKTQGAYVYVSYFLTGENRPYDRKRGVFGRVKPLENFFRVRGEDGSVYTGKGAWEVKYRYSWLDAYDNGALGFQTCGDHTLGLNWYLTPYTRFMFEYIHSSINQNTGLGVGQEDIFQTRAAIDF
jgi:phosphate-selective porin OprO/OprP